MAVNKDGVYIAEDKDFQLMYDFWIYKGEPLEVDITNFVNSKNLKSTNQMFSGMSPFDSTAVERVVLGKNSVTNMDNMFNYSQATSLDLSSFDTSSVTSMNNMFFSSQATSLDLSGFDTSSSSVTSVGGMFYRSQTTIGYARTQADADRFNSSGGKPTGLVFEVKEEIYIAEDKDFEFVDGFWVYRGEPLEVDITDFVNRKNLISAGNMFNGLSPFGSTAVKRVVLGKNRVAYMFDMFTYSKATSLDLSSFDTSSVTVMATMFYNAQATSLDLSGFDTSSVTNMGGMFYGSQATTGYARTQADADKFNSSGGKPTGLVFVAKTKSSFGTLNNHRVKSMPYKDSNGMIKQIKTLKYKDNLGNITKLK